MVDVAELKRRHEALSAIEDNKDKLIADWLTTLRFQDLVSHVEKLLADLRNEKSEFTDQKELARSYKEKAKKSRDELGEEQRKKFLDSFVQDGQNGGRSAAKALIEAVQGHVQTLIPKSSPNIQYCIRVYANVAGLTKTYRGTDTVSSNDTLEAFIRGFNMENVLCDFVNAGNGKECVDVKIRAHFDRDLLNIHCQHIVFCGSADNGYARILGPHRGSNRILLVEGPPFAHELKALVPDFETTSFSTKGVCRRYHRDTSNHAATNADPKLRLRSEDSCRRPHQDNKSADRYTKAK
ncbi:hypothetical protein N7509_013767 [Penicillium cosmopolitanum]|uniref:DUF7923 domain-containing protein n=1 Tax=Penicillium cosmopolitanum TaxID=1131564 RepID=A0A9W9SE10_9EURO|nr:uncharacterized protein N7509_013767 [Penicillium cosmopolitanum]KAJ5376881.1 hypothetical protein N7509_013767 [Penicillium cosmopolitanum]